MALKYFMGVHILCKIFVVTFQKLKRGEEIFHGMMISDNIDIININFEKI